MRMDTPNPNLLKNGNFSLLLLTRLLGMTAIQAQVIIVGWQVYELTHSTLMLGLVGLVEAIPAIICALYAGHIVDTRNPLRVFQICIGALALTNVGFLIVAGGFIPLEKEPLLVFIFAGVFMCGVASSFVMPAGFSLTASIVARKDYSAASAWQSGAMHVATIGGPAIAGILYGFTSPGIAWLMPVSLLAAASVTGLLMRVPHTAMTKAQRPKAVANIREGWRFLRTNNALLAIMALDMLAVLLGGAIAILPAFADQILHTGAEGLGALRAAPAIGAVLMALLLALRPMKRITARQLLFVVAGFGLCMIGFGLSTTFWVAALMLAASGAFDAVSMVIRGTLTQLLTPDGMRGRVSAVNSMFIITSNEIGAFESGVAASLLGLVPSIVLGGVGTIAVVIGTALFSPRFRKLSVET